MTSRVVNRPKTLSFAFHELTWLNNLAHIDTVLLNTSSEKKLLKDYDACTFTEST